MGTGDILLGVTPRWTSIPSRGSSNTPRLASCYGNQYKLQPCEPLAHVRLYLFTLCEKHISSLSTMGDKIETENKTIGTPPPFPQSIQSWGVCCFLQITLTAAQHCMERIRVEKH